MSFQLIPGAAAVPTTTPKITIDSSNLSVGTYTFSLVVEDASGARSPAASIVLKVVAQPRAVLTGPAQVTANDAIDLDGSGSTDPGGSIVNYYWSVVVTPTTPSPPTPPPPSAEPRPGPTPSASAAPPGPAPGETASPTKPSGRRPGGS